MLKMVHGTSSEHLLWPMVRYAQQSGNDAICKAILLTHLGEPNAPDVMKVVSENEELVTQRRDVGKHAKTVVELLYLRESQGENVTMSMLVKDWRSTGAAAEKWYVDRTVPPCIESEKCPCLTILQMYSNFSVKDNPPGKDGLSTDDCERIVTSLLLEKVIATNPKWNAYEYVRLLSFNYLACTRFHHIVIFPFHSTIVYLVLGELGPNMLSSKNPKFIIRLPTRQTKKASDVLSTKGAKQSSVRKTLSKNDAWLSTKSTAVKRKKAATATAKAAKKVTRKTTKKAKSKDTTVKKPAKRQKKKTESTDIIELSSDDDEVEPDVMLASLRQDSEPEAEEVLWDDEDDVSDEEYEFES
jgi:hypothetical protein